MHVLKLRLRELHGEAQTLAPQTRREEIGKASPRCNSFPGSVEQPSRRKRGFANVLKRIGKELDRQQRLAAHNGKVETEAEARTADTGRPIGT